ncbi:NAD(+) synthase [Lentimicrobium sp.]|mgnify:FL=1|jgi:NAD+ synthase|uniref:NAD(+) synthase n=1 Tax=Lentimicrobium sp. TaxID=2034841 RepID=UPI0026007644|nr:NAD(+) synthase [Lentimicrobium sp.]MCO5255883.1 NAD(+) synthase [Lentimicrobium sp.]MCO5262357.1 NAD(+) synthase [Lentimicrobium sp.]HPF65043.1 NAD(+) synthase [Lentimicrobium sp.]HPJ62796.1 NAD(+) synthase [Lentimicrobium sp.]HPR27153.1 NAD(+) synthase [Lentimicrobium sp.]
MNRPPFSKDILKIKDIEALADHLGALLKEEIFVKYKRRGAVVGISGGIDSSVSMALAAKYIGAERVFGVMMPEKDSSPDSESLAEKLAKKFGVPHIVENIRPALEGFKCYERRDEAIKRVFPEFDPLTDKSKIGINKTGLDQKLPPVFHLTIIDKNGNQKSKIIPINEYLQIVAASNFKQRCRMSMVYYYAEKMHYMVIGTANKHEIDQGFFVKYGDGGADFYPQAHLYKTQVYQLAGYLGVPDEIIQRTPTTDTYSAEQTQEEFFYQLPFEMMDPLWYGFENGYSTDEVGEVMGIPAEEVQIIFDNFARKKKTTEYLRANPYYFPVI